MKTEGGYKLAVGAKLEQLGGKAGRSAERGRGVRDLARAPARARELIRGEPRLMAPSSIRHAIIERNAFRALDRRLELDALYATTGLA